jgi:hypothetical protein
MTLSVLVRVVSHLFVYRSVHAFTKSRIDIDQQEFVRLVSASDTGWQAGLEFYNQTLLRTLSQTSDGEDMLNRSTQEFYTFFEPYFEYMGSAYYPDDFITNGLEGSVTTSGYTGNFDFSNVGQDGRSTVAETAPVLLALFLYIVRNLELAVEDCHACVAASSSPSEETPCGLAWLDQAVAYYVGSLEGEDGSGDGYLWYALADRLCPSFATCVPGGTTSRVNANVMGGFSAMQQNLQSGLCSEASNNKNAIRTQLSIPLVQGVTLALFQVDDDSERFAIEATMYAAALLPPIQACNADDASALYEATKPGGSLSLPSVRRRLLLHYPCLNLTCEDVGGLWNELQGTYYSGYEPCGTIPTVSPGPVDAPTASTAAPVSPTPLTTAAPVGTSVVFPSAAIAQSSSAGASWSWSWMLLALAVTRVIAAV